jgi:5-oxoprolinase (ATP-hydrolysing)
MGGTSTDVSRYAGHLEHVFESVTAGVAIQAPQLDIHTVAAGGGSCLFLKRGMFIVGPESAGAHPGNEFDHSASSKTHSPSIKD